jgi:hypothetical protein
VSLERAVPRRPQTVSPICPVRCLLRIMLPRPDCEAMAIRSFFVQASQLAAEGCGGGGPRERPFEKVS